MDMFGIGNALKDCAQIYFTSARNTGRTTALVESLKTGDRVVFCNSKEADRVKRLAKERGVEISVLVVPPADPGKIFTHGSLSRDGRCIFDHSWLENFYLNDVTVCRWRLFGLTSWGQSCASENKPGIYTRLSNYLEWIHQHID